MYTTPDYIHEPLYVVCAIFNPIRYQSRWKHYERFARHVKDSGAILVTIEASFGDRHHALDAGATQFGEAVRQRAPENDVTFDHARSTNKHIYIRVNTTHELWVKENLQNIALTYLPSSAEYIAFVDADVMFARPNWVGETIHQLQHYDVVQMFSDAHDVGPNYGPLQTHKSFMYCYLNSVARPKGFKGNGYYSQPTAGPGNTTAYFWHPGFAWAWRRDALSKVGRLIDWAILGAADNHMAHALIGEGKDSMHPAMAKPYKDALVRWEKQAEQHIRRNVGYVSGLLLHYWHGAKVDRKYWDRWQILVKHQYNPLTDIKYDWQGMLQLNDHMDTRSIRLRDDLRKYFRQRNEDDVPQIDV